MFNEELITWSIDGGGRFFYRLKHKFSVTNVCGYMRVSPSRWNTRFVYYLLDLQHKNIAFDYQTKAHPSVIKNLYFLVRLPIEEQTQIAVILSTIDRAIEQTEAIIAKQQRIKTGLMQDLLTKGIDEDGNVRSEATHAFKDSPLGKIPAEYEVKILDHCVKSDAPICYGILMPGTGHDNGVPVIKVKDIYGGMIHPRHLLLTDPKIDSQYKRSKLHEGDILLTIRGTTGRLALVPTDLKGANITQDTARIRLKEEHSNQYFYFLLQSKTVQDQVLLHTLGQAVKGINISEVKKICFALPMKNEQLLIANRLNELESFISSTMEQLNKFYSLKTGLMQDLLTGNVRVTALLNDRANTSH